MQQRNDTIQKNEDKRETAKREAELDETIEESFPASDPPSWTLGTDHRKEYSGRKGEENG